MPMGSDRGMPGLYQIYLAERSGSASGLREFGPPEPVTELSFEEQSTVDGFLTDDGLSLFYVTGPEIGPADMYVASRRATTDRFELAVPLSDLNTESDERDPWLSPDGSLLFFASDRSGRYEIYVARVHRERVSQLRMDAQVP
jgi:Tol biopolymer transport system component